MPRTFQSAAESVGRPQSCADNASAVRRGQFICSKLQISLTNFPPSSAFGPLCKSGRKTTATAFSLKSPWTSQTSFLSLVSREESSLSKCAKYNPNRIKTVRAGFTYHHCEATYLVLTAWFKDETLNKLPPGPVHFIGVAGFVVREVEGIQQVLVIRERSGPTAKQVTIYFLPPYTRVNVA